MRLFAFYLSPRLSSISIIVAGLSSVWPLEHTHLYIRGSLTNGRKGRRGEQRISTCEHREWWILVVNCFFFAALSAVIGQAGKVARLSPLSLSLHLSN